MDGFMQPVADIMLDHKTKGMPGGILTLNPIALADTRAEEVGRRLTHR